MDQHREFHTDTDLDQQAAETKGNPGVRPLTGSHSSPDLSPNVEEAQESSTLPEPIQQPIRETSSEVGRFLDQASRPSMTAEMKRLFAIDDDTPVTVSRHHLDEDEVEAHHRTSQFPHMHHTLGSTHGSKKKSMHPSKTKSKTSMDSDLQTIEEAKELREGVRKAAKTAVVEETSQPDDEQPGTKNRKGLSRVPSDQPSVSSAQSVRVDFYIEDQEVEGDDQVDIKWALGVGDAEPSPAGDHNHEETERRDTISGAGDEEDKSQTSLTKLSKSKHGSKTNIASRRRRGSEVKIKDVQRLVKQITDQDEAAQLQDADLDELASHRLGHGTGAHRHRHGRRHKKRAIVSSVVHIGKAEPAKPDRQSDRRPNKPKMTFDHHPHELFVEMDELKLGHDQEWVWQEKARWIKFEEDMEEGAERWGKPHVASLSFHSLLELRRCLEQGAVCMDLEADDLPTIAEHVADQLISTGQLPEGDKSQVLQCLLLRHKHVDEPVPLKRKLTPVNLLSLDKHSSPSLPRRDESPKSSTSQFHRLASVTTLPKGSSDGMEKADKQTQEQPASEKGQVKVDMGAADAIEVKEHEPNRVPKNLSVDFKLHESPRASFRRPLTSTDPHILKKIPPGAEGTTVLVGPVDFLEKPIMAFVRLAEGRYLGKLTEVPLPVRFIFLLMGPVSANLDYHEVGRSISTLMANTSFHDVAYRADHRQDLLDAINEFLEDSIVLPPGNWDKETLLPVMDMARERARKRAKKKEAQETVLAPAEGAEEYIDPMVRTKRLFGGMVNDIKRRYPKYVSDLKDGLNMQCLATFFFIYFACLSPAITFGGLLSEQTNKWMGVSEMLVSTCINGVLFALLSGQPLIVVGATGPVLVFEEALFQICESFALDYLSLRFWVGIWVTLICTLVVMFEGGVLVRYCTRFTEEIFALLISLIFIYETFKKLYNTFNYHPLVEHYPPAGWCNCTGLENQQCSALNSTPGVQCCDDVRDILSLVVTNHTANSSNDTGSDVGEEDQDGKIRNQPNTAVLSLVLTLGTFLLAYALKLFRSSKFLGRPVRRAIGDFGITIAIVTFVVIDLFATKHTYIEKLDVPDGFSVTAPYKRGWIVNPMGMASTLQVWAIFLALVPALLIFILMYMETQITSVIINKSDHKLKKGSGFHMDLFLTGCFATVSAVLGLPFMCSATVRSVTHLSALSIYSRTHAPGEKPKLLSVTEQRVTGLAVHIMIGVSVLMGPVLRHIPLATLFGVFLYMGIATLTSIELVERIRLLFMPAKHHSGASYVRGVRTLKMHLFTMIQLVSLGVLWAVKSTKAALAFPFVLILLIPFRLFFMRYMFTPNELSKLDRGEEDVKPEDEEDEPDFYEQAHMPF